MKSIETRINRLETFTPKPSHNVFIHFTRSARVFWLNEGRYITPEQLEQQRKPGDTVHPTPAHRCRALEDYYSSKGYPT